MQNTARINVKKLHKPGVVITGKVHTVYTVEPGYYECGPQLLSVENKRKTEPKEIPSRLIPHLLVVFTRQLEILETTLVHQGVEQGRAKELI